MYRILLILIVLTGCSKASKESDKPTPAPNSDKSAPNTPPKKLIESGQPEFDTMLADLKENPGSKKYVHEIVTFVMTVESVKEVNKNYLVKGAGSGVNLVCTFIIQANIQLNVQAPSLAAGDKVYYMAEPTTYKPGTPPTITSYSGSILRVEKK